MSKAINFKKESETIMSTSKSKSAAKSNSTSVSAPVGQVETNAVTIVAATPNKADKARVIFSESYADKTKVPQRKDIINRMVAEAGLTKAGAATYLQNMKKKAGLVMSKTATPTA